MQLHIHNNDGKHILTCFFLNGIQNVGCYLCVCKIVVIAFNCMLRLLCCSIILITGSVNHVNVLIEKLKLIQSLYIYNELLFGMMHKEILEIVTTKSILPQRPLCLPLLVGCVIALYGQIFNVCQRSCTDMSGKRTHARQPRARVSRPVT